MIDPSDLTVIVVMIGETDYWSLTRPFIERYCEHHGYSFRVFTENCLAKDAHPSWNKLIVPSFVRTSRALVMDADIVPLPWAPPIHVELSDDLLSMVKIQPSRCGRMKLRRKYGKLAEPHLWWNCGLVSVPHCFKSQLRNMFFDANYDDSIFWEQGELNHYCYQWNVRIHELSQRWNFWVDSMLRDSMIDSNYFLHFAKGSRRRFRNVGRLYRALRLSGRLPE